ncbi:sigma 54-interacting transcriptional regulator [Pendulispora brunnea]|uniref:Sigma 54-interacting transcriptional regulator n=1 Tax=Pendulispora brunnea TaxID=2905690 RepID=A0ABZ2K382_9BACT
MLPMGSDWWDIATTRSSQNEPTAVEENYALRVLDGPQAGTRFAFGGTPGRRWLAGKGPACDFQLEGPMVSRRHAAFEMDAKGLRVTDLDSTNGTSINGVAIREAYANDGDRIRLAETTLALERGEPKSVPLAGDVRFGRMLGASPAMRRLYPLCKRFAESELPVLIEGETGTGKEVLAEALHEASPRARAPFVVFDCTAVPPTLVESTLFGHERGSFTGAVAPRKGVFEEAHGGTLFIDELGELDLSLQPKLLRALERSEVQRVGSNQWIRVDVRIIAATRRDLDREVQAGRFRDDLFFRLAVGRLELPPLRDRTGDVGLLACHFWQTLGGGRVPMPRDLIQRLEDYRWPGNVRELHNAVARALALGETTVTGSGITEPPPAPRAGNIIEEVLACELPLTRARERVVSEFERQYVERVLARHDGNVVRAAAASGIARRYFQILRARYFG